MPETLTTDRLTLRTFVDEDADALFDLHSRPEVQRWIGDGQPMTDVGEARASVPRRRDVPYPPPQGICGIATEAATRVLGHASDLPRIVAVTHPDNEASQRVARRLGMRDEGLTDRYYDTTTRLFVLER